MITDTQGRRWAIVPVEATPEMFDAVVNNMQSGQHAFTSMIAAAPVFEPHPDLIAKMSAAICEARNQWFRTDVEQKIDDRDPDDVMVRSALAALMEG